MVTGVKVAISLSICPSRNIEQQAMGGWLQSAVVVTAFLLVLSHGEKKLSHPAFVGSPSLTIKVLYW